MKPSLKKFNNELQHELKNILGYWMRFTPDEINGGFYGSVANNNEPSPTADKGVVLNARILWTFSAAYNETGESEYLEYANRAFQYLTKHFFDDSFGGVYWTVNSKGEKLNDRKQIYGLAFCIYGLSEYYKAAENKIALDLAIKLFWLIEYHAYDQAKKGYFEAFTRDWKSITDLRLSSKDANEKKTMNTHLHIAEAYASLYKMWPDKKLKQQLESLLEVFAHHIVNSETHHLHLFFDENWNVKSNIISFGHDIEAAWLLLDVAQTIHHPGWITTMQSLAVKIPDAVIRGFDKEGGLNYELIGDRFIEEKHWWPQAEAMIGFFNAFDLSKDDKYLHRSIQTWEFIKKYIRDKENGEWFWGVRDDYSLMEGYDKVGPWKCPYHNARACMELMRRTESIFKLPD